jgi:parallel beta-helix repeat protein
VSDDWSPPATWTRRSALSTLAAGTATLATSAVPSPAEAVTGRRVIAVDPAGKGDTTDLERAVAQAPPGTLITVAPGEYTIQTGQMQPRAGVTIRGAGSPSVVRAAAGLNRNIFQIHTDGVTVEGLLIDGNGKLQAPSSSNGVYFDAPGGGAVLGCLVRDCAGYNIVGFPGARGWLIQGNEVLSTGAGPDRWPKEGIELQGASMCRVIGNHVSNVRMSGVYLWNSTGDCSGNLVVGNTIVGAGRAGIWLEDGAHDNTIAANNVSDCTFGIRVSDEGTVAEAAARNVITANVCRRGAGTGVQLLSVPAQIVSSNVCSRFSNNGFHVRGGAGGSTLASNQAADNGFSGFLLEDVSDVRLQANDAEDNGGGNGAPDPWRSGFELRAGDRPMQGLSVSGNRARNRRGAKQLRGLSIVGSVGARLTENAFSAVRPVVVDGSRAGLSAAVNASFNVRVGTTPLQVQHGLGYAPLSVQISMRSAGSVWHAADPDDTIVDLVADAEGRLATLFVG